MICVDLKSNSSPMASDAPSFVIPVFQCTTSNAKCFKVRELTGEVSVSMKLLSSFVERKYWMVGSIILWHDLPSNVFNQQNLSTVVRGLHCVRDAMVFPHIRKPLSSRLRTQAGFTVCDVGSDIASTMWSQNVNDGNTDVIRFHVMKFTLAARQKCS